MIPKVIHYCWLSGDPYPEIIQRCIDSWKDKLPDYQFVLWDKNKFDINSHIWVKQAYESRKFAFAADYIRLYALYYYGGIYLDTDVEVLKSCDNLLNRNYFIGLDSQSKLEAAIIGSEAKSDWILACLKYYDNRKFYGDKNILDMKTLPLIMEEMMVKNGIVIKKYDNYSSEIICDNVISVFPFDFFCSKRHDTGKICITENTYSIHHFAMSWQSPISKILTCYKRIFVKLFGSDFTNVLIRVFNLKSLKEKLM